MKTQTIIFVLIAGVFVIYFVWTKFVNQKIKPDTDSSRPSDEHRPKQEKENDKLVVIDNVTKNEIDSILTGFCNMYNKENFQAQLRLYYLNEEQFAIVFPFDIDFEIYCYFINYVHYPMGFDKSFQVTGWASNLSAPAWIAEMSANKQIMLYIPEDDTEHDNVHLTTLDNVGYIHGFAMGEEKQLLDSPKKQFMEPTIDKRELINKEFKDYK